jgi:hypothetical protein
MSYAVENKVSHNSIEIFLVVLTLQYVECEGIQCGKHLTSWHHITGNHNCKIHHNVQNTQNRKYVQNVHKFTIKINADNLKQNNPYMN